MFLEQWSHLDPSWTDRTRLLVIAVTMQTRSMWNYGWRLTQWRFVCAWELDLYLYNNSKYFRDLFFFK